MHKAGINASDFFVNSLQARQELLDAEVTQGGDAVRLALKSRQMQGHGGGGLEVVGQAACEAGPGLG